MCEVARFTQDIIARAEPGPLKLTLLADFRWRFALEVLTFGSRTDRPGAGKAHI